MFFSILFLFLFVPLVVAFFTLFECKILGCIQFCSGPNEIGFLGLLQPFSDAISLFNSEFYFLVFGNYFIYYFIPVIGLSISLLFWFLYPFFILFLSFMVFYFFMCVWPSCLYYFFFLVEDQILFSLCLVVCVLWLKVFLTSFVFFIIICFILFSGSFNLVDYYFIQYYVWVFLCFPLFFSHVV